MGQLIKYNELVKKRVGWHADIPIVALIPLPRPIEDIKREMAKWISAVRWDHSSKMAFRDFTVSADDVVSAFSSWMASDLADDVNFKMPDGSFVTLTNAELKELVRLANIHVQACFTREAELSSALSKAESVAELQALEKEILLGWPT
jgi:hypothetical protein